MEQQWLALLAPWGQSLVADNLYTLGITVEWPIMDHCNAPEQLEDRSILLGSFVQWPQHASPVALYTDPSVTPTGREVKGMIY